jgi:hypothetical protein
MVQRASGDISAVDRLRVLVFASSEMFVLALLGVILAMVTGAATWWALVGFCGLVGALLARLTTRQVAAMQRTDPEQVLSGRELAKYLALAVAVAAVPVILAGVAAALS